ncbi:hypothetical protein [Pseudomonas chlororaphis]|uniref:hypothetical protein n=1 Tax=Pseudomonas chlororaphis TaxID=587753 RepID=UPI0039E0CF1B
MTTAESTGFAHRLGWALGAAARLCLHDRNPTVRWVKRVIVLAIVLTLLANSFSWILSSLLSVGVLLLGLYAVSFVDIDVEHVINRQESSWDDDHRCHPNRGDYDHPDYHLYFKD